MIAWNFVAAKLNAQRKLRFSYDTLVSPLSEMNFYLDTFNIYRVSPLRLDPPFPLTFHPPSPSLALASRSNRHIEIRVALNFLQERSNFRLKRGRALDIPRIPETFCPLASYPLHEMRDEKMGRAPESGTSTRELNRTSGCRGRNDKQAR